MVLVDDVAQSLFEQRIPAATIRSRVAGREEVFSEKSLASHDREGLGERQEEGLQAGREAPCDRHGAGEVAKAGAVAGDEQDGLQHGSRSMGSRCGRVARIC